MGGGKSKHTVEYRQVYVYPTLEQKQAIAKAKTDALLHAANAQQSNFAAQEARLASELRDTEESMMTLLRNVEQDAQLSVQERERRAKEREAELDSAIADLRAQKEQLRTQNIRTEQQVAELERMLQTKQSKQAHHKAQLDSQAGELKNQIEEKVQKQRQDNAKLEQILNEWLSVGTVTDASLKGLAELMCQLNNLPHVLDKASNTGLKEGLDTICNWLDERATSAENHLLAWNPNMSHEQTVEWAKANNLHPKLASAIEEQSLCFDDLMHLEPEDYQELFVTAPAFAVKRLKRLLDQARDTERQTIPRVANEIHLMRAGVEPACVWHDQVEGQAPVSATQLLSGGQQAKAITN